MHAADTTRRPSGRLLRGLVITAFAGLAFVASSQAANAQVVIESQSIGATIDLNQNLGGNNPVAPVQPFTHTVPASLSNSCLVVGVCVGKQTSTLEGLTVFWDPDGSGPTAEVQLTQIVGIFYEGNSPQALRGIHLFFMTSPPAGTGTIRVNNPNPSGLHMVGYAYTLSGVLTASPFNSVCTDTDPNSTPEASCTVGTSANNGLVLDFLVLVQSRSITAETPTPKGGITAPFRERTSGSGGGQNLRATSGAFTNTSTDPFTITGYTLPSISNAFLFVTLGFNPANLTPVGLTSFTGARYALDAAGSPMQRGVLLQ